MALGAQSGSLLAMVVNQGLGLARKGVAIGLAIAVPCGRALLNQLFGASALDPVTFASISTVLLRAASPASYIPARRAANVDPLEAPRHK